MRTTTKEALREMLADGRRRDAALVELADFVKQTCLLHGTQVGTAYTVAGLFVRGLEAEWRGGPVGTPYTGEP
jgi:hypothetical protein